MYMAYKIYNDIQCKAGYLWVFTAWLEALVEEDGVRWLHVGDGWLPPMVEVPSDWQPLWKLCTSFHAKMMNSLDLHD